MEKLFSLQFTMIMLVSGLTEQAQHGRSSGKDQHMKSRANNCDIPHGALLGSNNCQLHCICFNSTDIGFLDT